MPLFSASRSMYLVSCIASMLSVNWLLFFFFKQKTAYEMRISDWSSDVCSSDLYEPCARDVEQRGADGGGRRYDGQAQEGSRRASVRDDPATPRPRQIGRASCRERVCPYV